MDYGKALEWGSASVVAIVTAFSFCRKHYLKRVKPFFANFDNMQKQFKAGNGDTLYDKIAGVEANISNMDVHLSMLTKVLNSTLYLDPNPIFKADANGRFTFVNQAWLRLSGFSGQEEAQGTGWLKAIHSENRKDVQEQWTETSTSGSIFVMRHKYKNVQTGDENMVFCRTTLVKDNAGAVIQIIGLLEIIKES